LWIFNRARIRKLDGETPITCEAIEERLGFMRLNGDKSPSTVKALESVLEEARAMRRVKTSVKEAPSV
jgi:hypothetical protein